MFKDIFPLKIYEVKYPNYETIQESLIEDIISKFDLTGEEHKNHRLFTKSAYTLTGSKPSSIKKLHLQLKNQELVQWINDHIKIYWDGLGYDPRFVPTIYHMWANSTGKGDKVLHHNHSPFELTAVFYVNATPDMGKLALVNPNEMVLSKCPYYSGEESLQEKWFWDHLVDPEPGKLVIFPGWLYHKTQPNPTDEQRIVLGMSSGGIANMFDEIKEMMQQNRE